jgi:Fe-Mn family superoxide dismutase
MSFELADLPYPANALEPHISAETFGYHYGKHHKAYVDKLNAAIAGTDYQNQSLEAVILAAHEAADTAVFNNAAQAWNHTFLWNSMSPDGGGVPTGPIADAINERFGDLDGFREAFKSAAMGQFGSGWTWLCGLAFDERPGTAADTRCLGTCLLPGLPEQARYLHRHVSLQPDQLELRSQQLRG